MVLAIYYFIYKWRTIHLINTLPRFEIPPLYIQILQLLLDWTDFYIRLKVQQANFS